MFKIFQHSGKKFILLAKVTENSVQTFLTAKRMPEKTEKPRRACDSLSAYDRIVHEWLGWDQCPMYVVRAITGGLALLAALVPVGLAVGLYYLNKKQETN